MIRLLISDLHLSRERPVVTRAFFRFMEEEAAQADELYILGDLFEAWVGDDDPGVLARAVVTGLRKLSDGGTRLYFQHGNRDFLVGRRFAREAGCTLLPTWHRLSCGEQSLLLCHGDILCTEDRAYQRYRFWIRNPLVRWLLRCLPLKRRLRIAADLRARSLAANANKPENIMDVTAAEVERQLARHGAKVLIHGHTHRPGVHHHEHGERVVLGDWDNQGWFVRIEGDTIDLHDFPIRGLPEKNTEEESGGEDAATLPSTASRLLSPEERRSQADSPSGDTGEGTLGPARGRPRQGPAPSPGLTPPVKGDDKPSQQLSLDL